MFGLDPLSRFFPAALEAIFATDALPRRIKCQLTELLLNAAYVYLQERKPKRKLFIMSTWYTQGYSITFKLRTYNKMWVPTYHRIVQNKQQNMWVVASPGFTGIFRVDCKTRGKYTY